MWWPPARAENGTSTAGRDGLRVLGSPMYAQVSTWKYVPIWAVMYKQASTCRHHTQTPRKTPHTAQRAECGINIKGHLHDQRLVFTHAHGEQSLQERVAIGSCLLGETADLCFGQLQLWRSGRRGSGQRQREEAVGQKERDEEQGEKASICREAGHLFGKNTAT